MFSRTVIAMAFAFEVTAQTLPHVDLEQELWTSIKQALNGPDGDEYFQSSMKDALLPRLKGTLISAVPNESGTTLVFGMTDSTTPEAAMLVHDLPRELAPGTQIEFSAIPIGYSRDPFLVTFDTDKDSIVTKPFGTIAPSWYIGPALGAVRTAEFWNSSSSTWVANR